MLKLDPGCKQEPHMYKLCGFSCDIGFSIDGIDQNKKAGKVRCLDNGEWETPTCKVLDNLLEEKYDEIEAGDEKIFGANVFDKPNVSSIRYNKTESGKAEKVSKCGYFKCVLISVLLLAY